MYRGKRTKTDLLSSVSQPYTSAKFVGSNTLEIMYENGDRGIRLHDTDIITFHPDGDFTLNSGGWNTHTTRERMSEFLPRRMRVYSEKSIMYVNKYFYRNGEYKTKRHAFYDGMRFTRRGRLKSPELDMEEKIQRVKALKKDIARFVKLIDTVDELPIPSTGDCWYCCMTTEGQTLGDAMDSHDHLRSHIDEGYLHGSLLWNAMVEAGYQYPEVHWQMNLRDNFKRALRKYIYNRLSGEVVS